MGGRRLVVSDIHGEGERLLQALKQANYNVDKDQLFLLGDYVDRGTDSKQTVEIVMNLVKNGAIALKGNHDQMMVDAILEYLDMEKYGNSAFGGMMFQWFANGGVETLQDYDNQVPGEHIIFLKNLPTYYELDDYILVHAGLAPNVPLSQQDPHDLIWIREEFIYGYTGKTVVFGHTPVPLLNNPDHNKVIADRNNIRPWFGVDKIGIDTAAAYGGLLTVMDLDTKEIWQA